jgi:hypothetical protein
VAVAVTVADDDGSVGAGLPPTQLFTVAHSCESKFTYTVAGTPVTITADSRYDVGTALPGSSLTVAVTDDDVSALELELPGSAPPAAAGLPLAVYQGGSYEVADEVSAHSVSYFGGSTPVQLEAAAAAGGGGTSASSASYTMSLTARPLAPVTVAVTVVAVEAGSTTPIGDVLGLSLSLGESVADGAVTFSQSLGNYSAGAASYGGSYSSYASYSGGAVSAAAGAGMVTAATLTATFSAAAWAAAAGAAVTVDIVALPLSPSSASWASAPSTPSSYRVRHVMWSGDPAYATGGGEAPRVTGSAARHGAGAADAGAGFVEVQVLPSAGHFSFDQSAVRVGEGAGLVQLTVLRRGGSRGAASVGYSTADGTAHAGVGFEHTAGSLQFAEGQLSATVSVAVFNDDALFAGGSTGGPEPFFNVTLLSATSDTAGDTTARLCALGGCATMATVTIVDDGDAGELAFSSPSFLVDERSGSAVITVTRSGGRSGAVSASYSTVSQTAVAGVEFSATGGSVTLAANTTSASFTINVTDDAFFTTPNKTFAVHLTAATGGARISGAPGANVTVVSMHDRSDAGIIVLERAAWTVSEAAGLVYLNATRVGGDDSNVTVAYRIGGGANDTAMPSGAALCGGDGGGGALDPESGQCFRVLARAGSWGQAHAACLAWGGALAGLASAAQATFAADLLTSAGLGAAFMGRNRAGSAGSAWVDETGAALPYTAWGAGEPSALPGADYGVLCAGGTASGAAGAGRCAARGCCPVGVAAGQWAAQPAALPMPALCARDSGDFGAVAAGELHFGGPDAVRTVQVPVQIHNDAAYETPDETLTVSLTGVTSGGAVLGSVRAAVLTVSDDGDAGTLGFAAGSVSVSAAEAAGVATLAVARSGGVSTAVRVAYATVALAAGAPSSGLPSAEQSASVATEGADFVAAAGTLEFAAGVREVALHITLVADGVYEPTPQAFSVVLSAPADADGGTGGAALAEPALLTANVTIVDSDEPCPELCSGHGKCTSSECACDGGFYGVACTAVGTVSMAVAAAQVREDAGVMAITVVRTGGSSGPIRARIALTGGGMVVPAAAGGGSYGSFGSAGAYGSLPAAVLGPDFFGANSSGNAMMAAGVTASAAATAGWGDVLVDFLAGETSKTFAVTVVDDTVFESPDEAFTATLSLDDSVGGGATLGAVRSTVVTILDDGDAGTLGFAAGSYSVREDAGTVTLVVTRTGGSSTTASVTLRTANGTAFGGADFEEAAMLVLAFADGETSKTVTLSVVNDTVYESPDEWFEAALSAPTGGASVSAEAHVARVTVLDDGDAGAFDLPTDTYSVREDAGGLEVTVLRSGGSSSNVSVTVTALPMTASAGADYVADSRELWFADGVTSQSFTLPIANDTLYEWPQQVLELRLTAPGGGASLGANTTASVTILDDGDAGVIVFASAAAAVSESAQHVTVTLQRLGGTSSAVDVVYTALQQGPAGLCTATEVSAMVDGDHADFVGATGTVHFADGETTQSITIAILNDAVYESPDEWFEVALTEASGGGSLGAQNRTRVTITDDGDAGVFAFKQSAYSAREDEGAVVVDIERSGGNSSEVVVSYSNTAAAGSYGSYAASATAVSDYEETQASVVFADGEMSKTITISIVNDTVYESPDEWFNVVLTAATGGGSVGALTSTRVTVMDDGDAGTFAFGAGTYSVREDAGQLDVPVVRTGGQDSSVTLAYDIAAAASTATNGTDFVALHGSLTFLTGEMNKVISIGIVNDAVYESPDEWFEVALTGASGGGSLGAQNRTRVTITDDGDAGVFAFSANTYSVREDAGTVAVSVVRTGGSSSVGVVSVILQATSPSANAFEMLQFADGESDKTVLIAIADDATYESPDLQFTVTLTNVTGGASLGTPASTAVTILDDGDAGTLGFAASSYSVREDAGTVTLAVTRTGGSSTACQVSYTTTSTAVGSYAAYGSVSFSNAAPATAALDYVAVGDGVLSFADGELVQNITITILDDAVYESPDEWFDVALSGATGGASVGSTSAARVTVTDDGDAGTFGFSTGNYTVREDAGSIQVTVVRSGGTSTSTGSGAPVSVTFSVVGGTAVDGTDFSFAGTGNSSQVLLFADGESSKVLTVQVLGDSVYTSPPKTFSVVLWEAVGGCALAGDEAAVSSTVTMTDDGDAGTLELQESTVSVMEDGALALTVLRRHGSSGEVSVLVNSTDGTALARTEWGSAVRFEGTGEWVAVAHTPALAVPYNSMTVEAWVKVRVYPPAAEGASLVRKFHWSSLDGFDLRLGEAGELAFSNGCVRETFAECAQVSTNQGTALSPLTVSEPGAVGLGEWHHVAMVKSGTLVRFFVDAAQTTYAAVGVHGYLMSSNAELRFGQFDGDFDELRVWDRLRTSSQLSVGMYHLLSGSEAGLQAYWAFSTVDEISAAQGASGRGVTAASLVPSTVPNQAGGEDYVQVGVVLVFADGETNKTVNVTLLKDYAYEHPDQGFTVGLSAPSGGALLGAADEVAVTILDDGDAGSLGFAAGSYSVREDAGTVTLVVTRRTGSSTACNVSFSTTSTGGGAYASYGSMVSGTPATPGEDYEAVSGGVLSFADGEVNKTITITILDDAVYESPDQWFDVVLSGATGGSTVGAMSTARVTVTDDGDAGTFAFNASSYVALEDCVWLHAQVVRTGGSSSASTVSYRTANGTATGITIPPGTDLGDASVAAVLADGSVDYDATAAGEISFADGETSKLVSFRIYNDTVYESPDEWFEVVLTGASGGGSLGSMSAARVTVTDDGDAGTFDFANSTHSRREDSNNLTVTVLRSGGSSSNVSVTVTALPMTASAGADYVADSRELWFADGVTSQSYTLVLQNDNAFEWPNEVLKLVLSAPSGGAALGSSTQSLVTVLDDGDAGEFAFSSSSYTVVEDQAIVTLTINRHVGISGAALLNYRWVRRCVVSR